MTVFGPLVHGPLKSIVETTHLWAPQLRDWDTFRLGPSVVPFQLGPEMDPEMVSHLQLCPNVDLELWTQAELVGVLGVLDVLGVTGRQFVMVDFILTK